jgi:hypothetical protein
MSTPSMNPFDDLMKQVDLRANDFATPRNGAVFWTGYKEGNQTKAMEWAKANNKYTIEMTSGGKWLESLDLYGPSSPVSSSEADEIWKSASKKFASGASGRVNAFTQGTSYDPNRVFYGIELPELKKNLNVNPKITYRGY